QRLVYQQMCELGIRSRMVKRINKPTTQTDYDQGENNHYEKNNASLHFITIYHNAFYDWLQSFH
ncbi:hypothetical protein EFR49_03020, partial [Latilactobacillus curvatus]|uniref:hypothetical protein n=1 Tax=Latilactobacillus curvatus TaxID=28038 RepID=UPI00223B7978